VTKIFDFHTINHLDGEFVLIVDRELPVEEQLAHLFTHLGIEQGHVVAHQMPDFQGLVRAHPGRLASLTLLCPRGLTPELVEAVRCPLLVITGEDGPVNPALYPLFADHPDRTLIVLAGYEYRIWLDLLVDRGAEIQEALLRFLARVEAHQPVERLDMPAGEGQLGGVIYHVQGVGSPLLLFPIALAPSQWEPLWPQLAQQRCAINITGRAIGYVAMLERRGRTPGYLGAVSNVVAEAGIGAKDKILEVGCGSGVLVRWLAQQTGATNPITGIDINRHLLRDARVIAAQEGLNGRVDFREAHAEELPFADNSFDMTLSSTVLEEVDADRALAEMVRVTRPGGRVAVVTRAQDLHRFIHLPLPDGLRKKVEAPNAWGAGVSARGCADASLYRRMEAAGLTPVKKMPQMPVFDSADSLGALQGNVLPLLDQEERAAWQQAVDAAKHEGTFFYTMPYHGAVGMKP
jgi:ubiquinone/menaquinone biosynthesis C-methylase UbiE